jgi:hypothetical protein
LFVPLFSHHRGGLHLSVDTFGVPISRIRLASIVYGLNDVASIVYGLNDKDSFTKIGRPFARSGLPHGPDVTPIEDLYGD